MFWDKVGAREGGVGGSRKTVGTAIFIAQPVIFSRQARQASTLLSGTAPQRNHTQKRDTALTDQC